MTRYALLLTPTLTAPSLSPIHFFEAIRQDAIEVAKEILYDFPDEVWSVNEDGPNLTRYAVINRS